MALVNLMKIWYCSGLCDIARHKQWRSRPSWEKKWLISTDWGILRYGEIMLLVLHFLLLKVVIVIIIVELLTGDLKIDRVARFPHKIGKNNNSCLHPDLQCQKHGREINFNDLCRHMGSQNAQSGCTTVFWANWKWSLSLPHFFFFLITFLVGCSCNSEKIGSGCCLVRNEGMP